MSHSPIDLYKQIFEKMITRAVGIQGEQVAVDYFCESGYRILERNFKSFSGEIDIIAIKNELIVFFEVKSRNYSSYGSGLECVTPEKISKIIRTAEFYLRFKRLMDADCRFDVILTTDERVVEHIPNAFTKADASRKKHW